MNEKGVSLDDFVAAMFAKGDELYRDLPWRHVDDPYAVLVSEIMLQQTQVARVGRFWERFLSAFPTVDALAAAAVPDVLELWQGLGYNRRALALKRTADRCAAEGRSASGNLRRVAGAARHRSCHSGGGGGLRLSAAGRLSGDQRALGVLARALSRRGGRSDKVLLPLVEAAAFHPAAAADPRRWYYGLLDYGAHLKPRCRTLRRSAGHSRQSAFEGSRRQSAPGSPAAYSPLPRAFPARPCSPT
ncbi:MAG: adenine glycosylase [Adlercreutzia equolifaciens]